MAATARPSATPTPPGGSYRPRKSPARMRVPEDGGPAAAPMAEVTMFLSTLGARAKPTPAPAPQHRAS
eukprot:6192947-Pyramimonas_sp.AAC.1